MELGWKLKRPAYYAAIAILLLASVPPAFALEEITIVKPFTARSLSGIVVDSTGAPIQGAVVEECEIQFTPIEIKDTKGKPTGEVSHGDCTEGPILARTETNAHGYFSFPKRERRKAYYLHLTSLGFDPIQITVKLKFFARARVRIRLHIAT